MSVIGIFQQLHIRPLRQERAPAKLAHVIGLGIVLLFWAVVGTVVAGIGAATLGCIVGLLTRGVTSGRRRVITAASLFPFVCLGWGGAVFVFQAVVNEALLHRDL